MAKIIVMAAIDLQLDESDRKIAEETLPLARNQGAEPHLVFVTNVVSNSANSVNRSSGDSIELNFGEGKGGAAGFAKGGAEITLESRDGGTLLRYTVTATVGGKLAQIGSRLVDGVAHKMADQFFTRFTEQLQPAVAAATEVAVEAPPPAAEPAAAPGGLSPAIWITGVVVIVFIILLLVAI